MDLMLEPDFLNAVLKMQTNGSLAKMFCRVFPFFSCSDKRHLVQPEETLSCIINSGGALLCSLRFACVIHFPFEVLGNKHLLQYMWGQGFLLCFLL